jgi:hypothetical protein
MEVPNLPDGFRPTGRQFEIVMVDPTDCPAGHPFKWGTRGGPDACPVHGDHFRWKCACGQEIWRASGGFVSRLEC